MKVYIEELVICSTFKKRFSTIVNHVFNREEKVKAVLTNRVRFSSIEYSNDEIESGSNTNRWYGF